MLSLTTAASPTLTADYLFDVLKKPSYLTAWKALMVGQKSIPKWLQGYLNSFDGVAMPKAEVKIGTASYELYEVCKPHDCAGNENYFLFSPDHTKAWGAIEVDRRAPFLIGNPNSQQAALLLGAYAPEVTVPDAVNNTVTKAPAVQTTVEPNNNVAGEIRVPLKRDGGTFVVPVLINGAISLDFVIDSGAADVSIPSDVFSTLIRAGTVEKSDILGTQTYVLADGSKTPSITFNIKSLKLGNKIIRNLKGSVSTAQGSLLLGQSFLQKVSSWSIDNSTHELILR